MAACCTNQQRGKRKATGSWSSVEEDAGGGLVEDDSKLSPVTSTSALIGSNPPDEEVVQEEATPESGQMAASIRTNQRGASTATGTSCGSVEEDGGGRDKEDSKPSLVTSSSVLTGSYPDQEVVQEEATTPDVIPSGWTRVKLEPDC
jgi:hypothetical protein